jgi:uncharacterized protein
VLEAAAARGVGPLRWARLDATADPTPMALRCLGLNGDRL